MQARPVDDEHAGNVAAFGSENMLQKLRYLLVSIQPGLACVCLYTTEIIFVVFSNAY